MGQKLRLGDGELDIVLSWPSLLIHKTKDGGFYRRFNEPITLAMCDALPEPYKAEAVKFVEGLEAPVEMPEETETTSEPEPVPDEKPSKRGRSEYRS